MFSPSNGARIKYQNSPTYDAVTGAAISYGEDRSNPQAFDQVTGLPVGTQATVNITGAVPAAAPVQEPAADEGGFATVTKIADSSYETPPVIEVAEGLTIRQIRNIHGNELSLSPSMIALVNGEQVGDNEAVNEGDSVVFKEPAKRRG